MKNNSTKFQVKENKKDISDLKKDMKRVLTNDIPHIKRDLAKISTDVCWLKKWMWLVAAASVGGLITGIVNFLFK